MLRSVIVRVAGCPRLCSSLPSWTDDLQHRPVRANRVRHSTHTSLVKSLVRFTAFRSSNFAYESSRILNPKSSSRVLDHLQSPLAPKPNCSGSAARVSRSRVARRSPRCCWPCRPEWKRFEVVGQWASHPAASAHTQRHSNRRSGVGGDETPAALSARVPRTETRTANTFTQERCRYKPEGVRHNVAHSPKDVYHILW